MPTRIPILRIANCCAVILLLAHLTACNDSEVVSYSIPKEVDRAAPATLPAGHPPAGVGSTAATTAMPALPGMQEIADAAPDIHFTLPNGWVDAGSTGMRKANLRVDDSDGSAEITALTFPGDVGGTLANINRWCGQVGLETINETALQEISAPITIANHGGLYVRLEGKEKSILAGILPFHGSTWFFKMLGDTATVQRNEPAMKTFLNSIQIEDAHH